MRFERNDYPLTLLYDGACPVCRLEMDRLAQRDSRKRLVFADIAAPDFELARYAGDSGTTLEDLNLLIHAMLPDGTLVAGVEVFRLAYGAVGLGPWFAPTALPLLKPLFDRGYAAFARNRYAVSALLGPVLVRIAAARAARRSAACADGARATNPPSPARSAS